MNKSAFAGTRVKQVATRSTWLVLLAVVAGCGSGGGGPGGIDIDARGTAGDEDARIPDASDLTSDAGDSFCDPAVGTVSPLAVCGAPDCVAPIAGETSPITAASNVPGCKTTRATRPSFDDSPARAAVDVDGTTRYRCEYRPPGTSSASERPLVVWLHGAGSGADDVYNATSLRTKATSFVLSGDATRPGFILVSVQGRNLHWPTVDPRDGAHHDIFHRDLAADSSNRDIANIDAIVDGLVAEGVVDANRIYLMGWSNGGFFAELYAIARHETFTAGGNRVAAVAAYTAADPFHEAVAGESPSCRLSTSPRSAVPLFLISRACDIIACSEDQAASFRASGRSVSPGAVVETWMDDLAGRVGDANGIWRIVSGNGTAVTRCTAPGLCLYSGALVNHVRWPDGVADGGGVDHEPDMLTFLRDNPLSRP